jgi:hypothetical protein
MADFSFLDSQKTQGTVEKEFTLHGLTMPDGSTPILIGIFAGETNPAYWNAQLKRQGKRLATTQAAVKAGDINSEHVKQGREDDRELYPIHVIKGWKNVVDAEGKTVAFNTANCQGLFEHLPNETVEALRGYFGDHINFAGEAMTLAQAQATGKG